MNRQFRLRLVFGVLGLALLAAPATQAQEATPAPPFITRPRLPPTIKLQLQPAAAPVPALKYALLPPYLDRTPGNAAPMYYRTMLALRPQVQEGQKVSDWLELPLRDLPRDDVRRWLAGVADRMQEVRAGARREQCDWDLPIRGNADLISLRLEEVQESRYLIRVLTLQARMQMLDGRYDEAVETFQTAFGLARHLNQVPIIIPGLVAVAMVSITAERILEFAEQPGSPNLYWALSALPTPFIDPSRSLDTEGAMAYQLFPFLRDARTVHRTPEQWQALMESMARKLARWGGLEPLFRNEAEMSPAAGRLLVAGWSLKGYSRAKQHLIDQGLPSEEVEKMPVGQVIAIYTADVHDEFRDEVLKWQHIPWPQANQGMQLAESQGSRGSEIVPVMATLTPAYRQWIHAARRADRRIAELRVIEALRLYAAAHHRQLPPRLEDISEVPIPVDPLTGHEFGYRLEGTTAILEVAPPPGFDHPSSGKRYELTIAKP
jgi:hypothetical protein